MAERRYQLRIAPSVQRDLRRIVVEYVERIRAAMESLITDPRPTGCKKLKGRRDLYRVRVGDYRIIYEIEDAAELVSIARVMHRSQGYGPGV